MDILPIIFMNDGKRIPTQQFLFAVSDESDKLGVHITENTVLYDEASNKRPLLAEDQLGIRLMKPGLVLEKAFDEIGSFIRRIYEGAYPAVGKPSQGTIGANDPKNRLTAFIRGLLGDAERALNQGTIFGMNELQNLFKPATTSARF